MWGSVEHPSRANMVREPSWQLVETNQGLMHYNPKTQEFKPAFGPDGSPIAKKTSRGSNGVERRVLSFYNRAKEASETLMTPGENGVPDLETRFASQGAAQQLQGKYAPNMLQTKEQQMYRQAQRAFTEARLRKDSGAAIRDEEYAMDSKIYFAEPGDSPELVAQKRAARQSVLDSLAAESGHAYSEFYGEAPRPTTNTRQEHPINVHGGGGRAGGSGRRNGPPPASGGRDLGKDW
jgi:hypothetical protein